MSKYVLVTFQCKINKFSNLFLVILINSTMYFQLKNPVERHVFNYFSVYQLRAEI